MELYQSLFEISKLLLVQADGERTAEVLLARVSAATDASRGFVVVRKGAAFEQVFDAGYDAEPGTREERRFSRSLVREAIESGELMYSPSLLEDPRLERAESLAWLGDGAALVVPLRCEGEVFGALYLERRAAGGFTVEARQFVAEFAEMAALCLRTAVERAALRQRTASLERDLFSKHDFRGIVTGHPKMLELLSLVAQVADSDANVLLEGESGTGKELVAQALHWNSPRRGRPFVTLHCAALPATLLESELFGHVRGAFTGAERDRKGRIAQAEGGTLFLDEAGEIPAEMQAKLLRFLQFGEVQRVGSDQVERVDVRVVAATLQDLGALVRAGRFRQDLYFRLKVIELRIPPLRERRSDIALLAAHFTSKHWRRPDLEPRWSQRAQRWMHEHPWPGNVRELEHLVQRVCVLARDPVLDVDLFPPDLVPESGSEAAEPAFSELTNDRFKAACDQAVAEVERKFLQALMDEHGGNVSKAAREAGIERRHLQRLLQRHKGGLGQGQFRP